MALPNVGTETSFTDNTENTILTYVPVTGEFLRGFKIQGNQEAKVTLKIGGTVKHIDVLEIATASEQASCGHSFTPIVLDSGSNVTLHVTKLTGSTERDYTGSIY